jgi:hypothetical protein
MNEASRILNAPNGLLAGMKACLAGKYIGSVLVLAYSLIDVLAWLAAPTNQEDVTRQDFVNFAEKYVIPRGQFECTGNDLYAARCSILHTFTAESQMSRKGNAIRIAYAWGVNNPHSRKKLESYGMHWIMLSVDTLCTAVEDAARIFLEEIENNSDQLTSANQRADRLFRNAPGLPLELP